MSIKSTRMLTRSQAEQMYRNAFFIPCDFSDDELGYILDCLYEKKDPFTNYMVVDAEEKK